jgi:threonine dehydratase
MFPIAQKFIDHISLVSDEDIRNAQRYLWTNAQMGRAGGPRPSPHSGSYAKKNERVGVIVCGANTPLETFNSLFATA